VTFTDVTGRLEYAFCLQVRLREGESERDRERERERERERGERPPHPTPESISSALQPRNDTLALMAPLSCWSPFARQSRPRPRRTPSYSAC
jgi:hypothetical protein